MKKFIKQVTLYLLIPLSLMVAISAFDNLDKKYSPNQNIIKLQNLSKFDSLDILFIGNSYSYSGIKNSMFDSLNIKTFNLSIATAGPVFYKLVLKDYLNSVKKDPRYVFLLVSPTSFSKGADNFVAYPIHRYLAKPLSNLSLATAPSQSVFLFPELLYKSYKKGINNILHFNKAVPVTDAENIIASKGYESSTTIIDDTIIKETEGLYQPFKKDEFSRSKYDLLLEIITGLRQKSIKVILFDLPTNKLNTYYSDEFNKKYDNIILDLKKKYDFISLSQVNLKDSCYRNLDHMNDFGAAAVTANLINTLKQLNYN